PEAAFVRGGRRAAAARAKRRERDAEPSDRASHGCSSPRRTVRSALAPMLWCRAPIPGCAAPPMLAVVFAAVLALSAAHADTVSVATLTIGRDAVRLSLAVDADRLMEACGSPPPLGEEWTRAEIEAV